MLLINRLREGWRQANRNYRHDVATRGPMRFLPAEDELAASRRAGFRTLWHVADRYEIRDGHLFMVLGERSPRLIAPAGCPKLPEDLSRLLQGDEEAVLTFARTWGHVGWQN